MKNRGGTRALTRNESSYSNQLLSSKRSQLTIFIIIAILIVGAVALFFTFKSKIIKTDEYPPEISPVANFVQECLGETAENSIYEIAQQGGYFDAPEENFLFSDLKVPYYWINNSLFPEKEIIEEELSKSIEKNIGNCLQNFSSFKLQGYEFQESKKKAESTFYEDSILIKLDYPLRIKKGEQKYKIKTIEKKIDSNFYKDYLIIEEIILEQQKNPNSVPLSFISDLAYQNKFNFDIINGENEVLYLIVFDQDTKNEIRYYFAVKYNWEELK